MKIEFQILSVAIGGALGAISRYGISSWLDQLFKSPFAWGTLAVNVIGCFVAGMLINVSGTEKSDLIRLGIVVGYLGSLTTFSTFGVDTIRHLKANDFSLALGNIAANLFLGIGMVLMGAWLGKLISDQQLPNA